MKEFIFHLPILRADGYQAHSVFAESEAEAREKMARGESQCNFEELDIKETGEPELIHIPVITNAQLAEIAANCKPRQEWFDQKQEKPF